MPRALLLLLLVPFGLAAQNAVQAGRFHVEHPTLRNLGFEWAISGDDNRNATVEVEYRKAGSEAWRKALPLLRIGGEKVYRRREGLDYTVPHGFAGSILNVEPGTEYECRFTMADPDGTKGQTRQLVRVRTRTEPQPYAGGTVRHVYPPDYKGKRQEPAYSSLLEAYYGAGLGDWSVVWERRAQPGDTILLHAGLYRNERTNYVDPMMTPFDGTMSLTMKATAEKPLTIRSAGDGEVIFDGDNNHRIFEVMASAHHIFDGLTFRNTDVAIFAGAKEVLGAVALTVRNCRFENIGFGVWTEWAGSSDFYIADNIFLGRDDRHRLVGWTGPLWGPIGTFPSHRVVSYYAIKVYGPGHIIARNSVAFFHDAIGISTYGTPEQDPDRRASSIDIYGNDLHMLGDDYIETDGGVHNVRVFENRGTNAAHHGYSSQPSFGGPIYFYRNTAYHTPLATCFKFSAKTTGIYVFHNTIIGEFSGGDPYANTHWRNNLFLGRDTPGRGIMRWANSKPQYSSDYNGFRPNPGVKEQYTWLAPPAGGTAYEPKKEDWKTFASLADFQKATGQETHGIEVDFDIFLHPMKAPDPAAVHAVYHAADIDFTLNPKGKAVDAGVVIPGVNEDFQGKAPDLGAFEAGAPPLKYGPRWLKNQPFYR